MTTGAQVDPDDHEPLRTGRRLWAVAAVAAVGLAVAGLQVLVPWSGDRVQFLLLAAANGVAAGLSAWLFQLRWRTLGDPADQQVRNVFLPVTAHFAARFAIAPLDLEVAVLGVVVQSSWIVTQTLSVFFLLMAVQHSSGGGPLRGPVQRMAAASIAALAALLGFWWIEAVAAPLTVRPAGLALAAIYLVAAAVPLLGRSGQRTRREIWLGATFLLIAGAHLNLSWSSRPYDPPFMWGHLLLALGLLTPIAGAMLENIALLEAQLASSRRLLDFRRRLEVLLDSLPGIVLSIGPDLEVLYANRSAQHLLGLPPGLGGPGSWLDRLVDPGDRALLARTVPGLIQSNATEVWERVVRLDGPEGLVHWLSLELHPIVDPVVGRAAVQVVATDVTDLQLVRRTSESRQSRLVFLSNVAQTVAGEVAVERVLGRFLELGGEVYPLRSLQLWQPCPDLSHLETVLRAEAGGAVTTVPRAARTAIGEPDHPAWRAFRDAFPQMAPPAGSATDGERKVYLPLLAAGLSVGVLEIGLDAMLEVGPDDIDLLTQVGILLGGAIHLGRLVRELNEQRAVAMEASRLKSEFLANTSHELRTPLTAILGFLRLLVEDAVEDPARRREFLQITLDSAEKLLVLINDVLDLAKIEAGRLEVHSQPVTARQVIEDLEGLFRHQMRGRGVSFTAEAPTPSLVLWADRDRTTQILTNLVSNALKFTPRGGAIRVGCRAFDREVAFTVTDTGAGIPPDEVERVFESFYQVDGSTTRQHGGTGLGLTISRRLAELMGGTLTLDSPGINQGTTASLRLPSYRD